jgi:membrane protease YdiL (CAAX protease family)
MDDKQSFFTLYGKSPLYQLFVSLIIILVAGVMLLYLMLWAGTLIFHVDWAVLFKTISTGSDEKNVDFIRFIVISQDISLFIIPGIIILTLMKQTHKVISDVALPGLNEIVLVIILGFFIFPITSFTGQLNSEMHFPDWLSGIEQWMMKKEDQANSVIDLLIASNNFGGLMLNLFLIAVLPAIGEELIFRGVFQKIFYKLFKSGHLAIWFAAFVFSSLHFQFFGFVPRFILGLVFGYLFFWSGTLWLPVISHFVNNAYPVILTYVQSPEKLNASIDVPLWKQATGLPLPIIISLLILFYFRNKSKIYGRQGTNQDPLL